MFVFQGTATAVGVLHVFAKPQHAMHTSGIAMYNACWLAVAGMPV